MEDILYDDLEPPDSEAASAVDDLDDDLDDSAAIAVTVDSNTGQVAHTVHRMVQITNIHQRMEIFHRYHDLSAEYVQQRMAYFVDRAYRTVGNQDLNREGAAALFDVESCIVLTGEPDSGLRTAAVGLLDALSRRLQVPLRLREVTGQDAAPPSSLTEDAEPGQQCGYLLTIPADQVISLDTLLNSYRTELAKYGSYLVVVASREASRALAYHRAGSVLTVLRPDGVTLLRTEVGRLGIGELTTLVNHPEIVMLSRDAAPDRVCRLAELMRDATGEPETAVKEIIAAYKNWTEELAKWFMGHPDVRERAFLAAVAIAEGRHGSLILFCADSLQTALHGANRLREGLGEAGIRELARKTGASVSPDGTVRFDKPAYGSAVLDYLRLDRSQEFHRRFWDWVCRLPIESSPYGRAAAPLISNVADVLLDAILRHRDSFILRKTAFHWSSRHDFRPALVAVLSAAALSPEAGRLARDSLNRWAAQSSNTGLHCVIAEVCSGTLADTYPAAALVRLSHLAARRQPAVVDAVIAAMERLWERSRLRHRVLDQLLQWLLGDSEQAFATACTVIRRLDATADGITFFAAASRSSGVHGRLTDAIGKIVDHPTPAGADLLAQWLTQSVEDPTLAECLWKILLGAVAGPAPGQRIARLVQLALAWSSAQDEAHRRDLRDRLVNDLSNADPMVWRTKPTREG